MTFGGYAYGSSAFGSSSLLIPCPPLRSDLVVMETLERLKDIGIYIDYSNILGNDYRDNSD